MSELEDLAAAANESGRHPAAGRRTSPYPPPRKSGGVPTWVWVVGVIAALAVIGSVMKAVNPQAKSGAAIDVDAASLMVAWVQTPQEAATKYNMQTVRISGLVDDATANSETATIVLHTRFAPRRLVCMGKAAELGGVRVGQLVTIEGTCTPLDRDLVILNCRQIGPGQ